MQTTNIERRDRRIVFLLKWYQAGSKISHKALAQQLGISKNRLAEILEGAYPISRRVRNNISHLMGIPREQLESPVSVLPALMAERREALFAYLLSKQNQPIAEKAPVVELYAKLDLADQNAFEEMVDGFV